MHSMDNTISMDVCINDVENCILDLLNEEDTVTLEHTFTITYEDGNMPFVFKDKLEFRKTRFCNMIKGEYPELYEKYKLIVSEYLKEENKNDF